MNLESDSFKVEPREWETNFFRRPWGRIRSKPTEALNLGSLTSEFVSVLSRVDQNFELLDFNLDNSNFTIAPILEDHNFRLVDSRISFETIIAKNNSFQQFELTLPDLQIIDFSEQFTDQVLKLTDKYLTENNQLISRFKNLRFFAPTDAERYFRQWILGSISAKGSVTCLLVDVAYMVRGYFIYQKKGEKNGVPMYKGILTVVDEHCRGRNVHLALQSYAFSRINEEEFFVNNTTQLTNLPIIRNHIKSRRELKAIEFTFMRSRI